MEEKNVSDIKDIAISFMEAIERNVLIQPLPEKHEKLCEIEHKDEDAYGSCPNYHIGREGVIHTKSHCGEEKSSTRKVERICESFFPHICPTRYPSVQFMKNNLYVGCTKSMVCLKANCTLNVKDPFEEFDPEFKRTAEYHRSLYHPEPNSSDPIRAASDRLLVESLKVNRCVHGKMIMTEATKPDGSQVMKPKKCPIEAYQNDLHNLFWRDMACFMMYYKHAIIPDQEKFNATGRFIMKCLLGPNRKQNQCPIDWKNKKGEPKPRLCVKSGYMNPSLCILIIQVWAVKVVKVSLSKSDLKELEVIPLPEQFESLNTERCMHKDLFGHKFDTVKIDDYLPTLDLFRVGRDAVDLDYQ